MLFGPFCFWFSLVLPHVLTIFIFFPAPQVDVKFIKNQKFALSGTITARRKAADLKAGKK